MQIRCRLHPSETLTNFCAKDQCLVELCATCICHHTQMHAQLDTLPDFQNISHSLTRASTLIDTQRAHLDQQKTSVLKFYGVWDAQKNAIFKTLNDAKRETLEMVERTFAELWSNYERNILEEEIRMGNAKGDRVKGLANAYQAESDKLFALQKDLSTPIGPTLLRKVFTEALPLSHQLVGTIQEKYQELERVQIGAEYRADRLVDVKHAIMDCLNFKRTMQGCLEDTRLSHLKMSRSQSNFSPKAPSQILLTQGNSRVVFNSKPKIAVFSNVVGQNQLMRGTRRSHIFGRPPSVQNLRS